VSGGAKEPRGSTATGKERVTKVGAERRQRKSCAGTKKTVREWG